MTTNIWNNFNKPIPIIQIHLILINMVNNKYAVDNISEGSYY